MGVTLKTAADTKTRNLQVSHHSRCFSAAKTQLLLPPSPLKLAKFVSPTPKTRQKQKRSKDTTTAQQRELGRVYKITRSFQCKRPVGTDKRSQDAFTVVSGGQGQAVHLWCARKIQGKNSDKNN